MTDKINIVFQDGQSVSAAQLNSLISAINNLIADNNNLQSTLDRLAKSELILVAQKNTLQTFTGDGQATTITNWVTQINKGIMTAATGILIAPTTGTYTIEAKTLISADNAVSPRSKFSILKAGEAIAISEDTIFQSQTTPIQNYRVTHQASATISLNAGTPILLSVQVWGASQARIFGDINTTVKAWLEF